MWCTRLHTGLAAMKKYIALDYVAFSGMTIILLSMDTCVTAIFPSGATTASCVSLQPPGISPQDSDTNPYPLTVYNERTNSIAETYVWNETLRVSIGSFPNVMRGIVLQARSVGSVDAVGEFVNLQDGFQYLRCGGSPKGTLTNTDTSLSYKLSFQWTSGGHHLGDIEFLVTVGNTRDEYWTFGTGTIARDGTTIPDVLINCPEDIYVTSLPESNGNIVSWSSPDCFNGTNHAFDVTCNETNDQFVTISTAKTVRCWCTSTPGTVATCDFQYTVKDITPPIISNCTNKADDLIFHIPNNQSKAKVSWKEPHANDNSGSDVYVSYTGGRSGDFFSLGITTITYTFSDPSGNKNQCIFNITVTDNIPPLIIGCEYNNRTMYKYLPPDQNAMTVTWVEPDATDNSAMDVSVNKTGGSSGDQFSLGTTTIEYTYTDSSGNSAKCTFDVTVLDITPPAVSDCGVKNGTTLEAYLPEDASKVAVSWSEPIVTDNSGVVNLSQTGGSNGDEFSLGVTTIKYIFKDESKNTNQCLFYIDVKDITPPKATCSYHHEVIRAYLPDNGRGVIVSWIEPQATDNSGEEVEILLSGGANGGLFSLGEATITYTFTDTSGNIDECTFQVLVLDVTPPVLNDCDHETSAVKTFLPADGNKASVTWDEPTATDNSGLPVEEFKTGGESGDLFPLGRSTITYTFTDSSGNSRNCAFDVFVLDITPPVIMDCPDGRDGILAYLPSSSNHSTVSWRDPSGIDNSAEDVNVTSIGGQNGGTFYHGKTEITYTFTDSSWNANHCIFNVTVVDSTPPIVLNCPQDIQASLPSNQSTVKVTWKAPSASDNSGDAVSLFQSGGNVGDMFPVGVSNITYMFYDTSENYEQCNFAVDVRDVTEPVISNCPVIIFTSTCGEKEMVSWLEPTATDNSKRPLMIKASENPRDTFKIGDHSVIYTFEDESGNTALCSFVVRVEKKSDCVHHTSYILFIALGFYLILVCLAIALCSFLIYRRKRNTSQYIISRHYDTLPESGQSHSNLIELNNFRPAGGAVADDHWSYDGSTAEGGIDPELIKAGYVHLEEKSDRLFDS